MDWLTIIGGVTELKFFQDLTLVVIVIGAMRSHMKKVERSVDGIRVEIHDLKGVFRDQNKRLGNVEGTVEAIKYQVYELQTNFREFKQD
jgi:hypothetical protein